MKLILIFLLHMLQTEQLYSTVQQIQQCGVHCSQGLYCKSRPSLMLSPCKQHQGQKNATSIHNVSLSTVLRCEEGKCSLRLNIATVMTLYDDIRGVFLCVHSAGMLERCQIVTFPHKARGHVTGKKVEVQYDCFSVRPEQDVLVTLKTAPNFCHTMWKQRYMIPGCVHEDLRRKVAECITGDLVYTVNASRREITVTVLNAPEDADYNLRLCLKSHTCIGTGRHKLGWPATENARRIQICPFKDNVKELWSGVTYDHYTQALTWKPSCPVKAVVSLCHAVTPTLCLDIKNVSLSSERHNVMFSTVDPHPQLCMKFITEAGFWIECPFSYESFPVWDLKVSSKANHHSVEITSWLPARFSVGLCKMSSSAVCEPSEENASVIISVDKTKPGVVNLSMSMCSTSMCIQVMRIDVQLAIQEHRCNLQCYDQQFDEWSYSEGLQKYTLPLVVCVIMFVVAALVGKVMMKETENLIHKRSEDVDKGLRLA